MAKKIKFNLIVDDNIQVASVESLQDNFYVKDVIEYYKSGTLVKWLESRDEYELAEMVDDISSDNNIDIVRELADIFELNSTFQEIEAATLAYEREKNKISTEDGEVSKLIEAYYEDYRKILEEMKSEENIKKLEVLAKQLTDDYGMFFKLQPLEVVKELSENIKAIFACLTIEDIRQIWLENEKTKREIDSITDSVVNENPDYDFIESYTKNTSGQWTELEYKDKQVMVLAIKPVYMMEDEVLIKNYGAFQERFNMNDVNNKYLIFNGLEIQAVRDIYHINYLEV